MPITAEQLEAAMAAPEPTEVYALRPGIEFIIQPIQGFDTFIDLNRATQEKMQRAMLNQISVNGRVVAQVPLLVTTALILEAGTVDPHLSYVEAVRLLGRFGGYANNMADRISVISGVTLDADAQVKQAEEALQADPPVSTFLPSVSDTSIDSPRNADTSADAPSLS